MHSYTAAEGLYENIELILTYVVGRVKKTRSARLFELRDAKVRCVAIQQRRDLMKGAKEVVDVLSCESVVRRGNFSEFHGIRKAPSSDCVSVSKMSVLHNFFLVPAMICRH